MIKNTALIIIFSILVLGITLFYGYSGVKPQNSEDGVFCTMEAKLCSDGSYVGRTGPNCEFAECPSVPAGILPYNSGVRGVVIMGPTCPVMQNPPDPQCADKPYQTSISVFRSNDLISATVQMFASTKSATDGTFEISLPPGDYILGAVGGKVMPRCAQVSATVPANGYTQITISCDTGIR